MRIYLRAFEIEDYKLISQWRNDDEMNELYCGNRFFVSSERERKWVEQQIFNDKERIYFAICLKEDGRLIGYESIINIDLRNRKAEWGGSTIGEKSLWGKGLAREAASLMLDYVFNELPVHKFQACCLEEHQVTKKMFSYFGFKRDGMFRDEVFKRGEFKSIEIYSILRDEYLSSIKTQ